jgi:Flp pilus assembly protein TadD
VAHNDFGAALFAAGRIPEALDRFDQASRLDQKYVQPWFNRATVLLREKQYEQAVAAFERAVQLNPAHQPAHGRLGYALEQLGRIAEAEAHYRKAVQLNPDDPEATRNLAELLFARSERDQTARQEASRLYRALCELNPNDTGARQRLDAISSAESRPASLPSSAAE